MTHLVVQEIEKKFINKKAPVLRPGYTVRVHQRIQEGDKKRIQIFEGVVLGINHGHGASKMVTVRKVVEGIGVEKVFPLYSPVIAKIEVIKTTAVRRAKLYYLRGLAGKSARLRTKLGLTEKDQLYGNKKYGPSEEDILTETPVSEESSSSNEQVPEESANPEMKAEGMDQEKSEKQAA